MDITRYKQVLIEIRDYLASFGDRLWTPVLDEWLTDLDSDLPLTGLVSHVRRSLMATGGMGSLGDFYIAAENGHSISDDPAESSRASQRLWNMTSRLYQEAIAIYDALRPGEPFRR